MGEDVACSGYPRPRYCRVFGSQRFRTEITNDLADDLKIADHGILGSPILHEVRPAIGRVILYPLKAFRKMPQEDEPIFQSSLASSNIRSRR